MSNKLPGKHAEVSIGDTLLDLTTDDIVVGGEEEMIEGAAHSDPIETREIIRGAPFIEVQSFVDGDLTLFEEAGIIDENGDYTPYGRQLEDDVTVTVYESGAKETPSVEITGEGCVPEWSEDLSFPEDDFAEYGMTFQVNDNLNIDTDPTAT